jgi:hypothetical protein
MSNDPAVLNDASTEATDGNPRPDGAAETALAPKDATVESPSVAPAAKPLEGDGAGASSRVAPRAKPTTVRTLIEYAYAEQGRKLQLTRKDLSNLARVPSEAAAEMDLVRRCAAGDPQLAVPPRILAAVAERGAGHVRERVVELALAAMVSHPVFAGLVVDLQNRAPGPALSADRVSAAVRDLPPSDNGLSAENLDEAARERLRVNAVTSFGLLRVLRDRWSLHEFVTEIGPALWRAPSLSKRGDAANAALLASARDTTVPAVLSGYFTEQLRLTEERTRTAQADASRELRRAQSAERDNRDLQARLEAEQARTQQLTEQVGGLMRDMEAERSNRVVDKSHLVDDYEVLRTQVLRSLTSQTELLSDGLHALRAGSVGVADEFVDRSLTAIQREVSKLKDMNGSTR